MSRLRTTVWVMAGLLAAGLLLLQFVPVGNVVTSLRREANPPVVQVVVWDSPATEGLVRAACFDCHSNETVWPWYSQIAPVSWLVTRDVNRGRAGLNFSEDAPGEVDVDDIEWHLYHDMPPAVYLALHPEANLTDEQKALLLDGLRATFGSDGQRAMPGMDMGESEDGEDDD